MYQCKKEQLFLDTYRMMAVSNVTEIIHRSVFLLLLACFCFGLSNAIQSNSLFTVPFDRANCSNTLEIKDVATIIKCAFLCGRRNGCFGFFYDKNLSVCLHVDPRATSDCTFYNSLTLTSWKKSPAIGRCSEYLVPGVPDNQMTSSSNDNAVYVGFDLRAHHARLNGESYGTAEGLLAVGAWVTTFSTDEPWIEIEFNTSMVVNGIATQGRFYNANDACCYFDQRVTKYTISYSEKCSTFTSILNTDGQKKSFTGNLVENSNAIQTNMLEFPVYALCVRLYPTDKPETYYFVHLSLDVVGCEYN